MEAAEVALRRGGRRRPPGLAWTLDNGPLLLLLDPGNIAVVYSDITWVECTV